MKKIIIAILMAGSLPAFAQKMNASKVPMSAQGTFTKSFPKATDAKWEHANGNYKASFTEGTTKISVIYNDKGERVQTEYPMEVKQAPGVITKYIADNYKGQEIKAVTRIDKPNTPPNYMAEVNGKNLLFGPNGQFIKAESTE